MMTFHANRLYQSMRRSIRSKVDTLVQSINTRGNSHGPDDVNSWAITEIQQEVYSFSWSIKNFSDLFKTRKEIKSPIFRGNHNWQIKLEAKKQLDIVTEVAGSLKLVDAEELETPLIINFEISVLGAKNKPIKVIKQTAQFIAITKRTILLHEPFLTEIELSPLKSCLLKNDTLKVFCKIYIEGRLDVKVGHGVLAKIDMPENVKNKRIVELASNLQSLLETRNFADFTITATSNKLFKAHKAVLSVRSPVFDAMFASDMLEASSNSMEIVDFGPEAVEVMLHYIYTGETKGNLVDAIEVIKIADKYDLPGLKEDCEIALAKTVTIENSADLLNIACLCNGEILKAEVCEFINRNKQEVIKTDSFQKIDKPAILKELYRLQ